MVEDLSGKAAVTPVWIGDDVFDEAVGATAVGQIRDEGEQAGRDELPFDFGTEVALIGVGKNGAPRSLDGSIFLVRCNFIRMEEAVESHQAGKVFAMQASDHTQ